MSARASRVAQIERQHAVLHAGAGPRRIEPLTEREPACEAARLVLAVDLTPAPGRRGVGRGGTNTAALVKPHSLARQEPQEAHDRPAEGPIVASGSLVFVRGAREPV